MLSEQRFFTLHTITEIWYPHDSKELLQAFQDEVVPRDDVTIFAQRPPQFNGKRSPLARLLIPLVSISVRLKQENFVYD
jgi:hypothetical protein